MSGGRAFVLPLRGDIDQHDTKNILEKVRKGARWMPWLTEAMKDVISCDKLGVGANDP